MMALKRQTPVVVKDLHPFQLLQSARAHGWNIPVIVISGYADDATRAQAKELGVTAFLEKPVDLFKLQSVLREALGREPAPVES